MPKMFQQCVNFIKKFTLAISRGKINLYSSARQINFEGILAQELISHLCMLGEILFSREEGAHEQEGAVSHGGGIGGG